MFQGCDRARRAFTRCFASCLAIATAFAAGCANDNVVVPTHSPRSRAATAATAKPVDASLDSIQPRKARPTAAAKPATTGAAGKNPDIKTLVEQSQRDVDAILKSRDAAPKADASSPADQVAAAEKPAQQPSSKSAASAAASPQEKAKPKEVIWNDTGHRPVAGASDDSKKLASGNSKKSSDGAEIRQSPLFRDPAEDADSASPNPPAAPVAATQPSAGNEGSGGGAGESKGNISLQPDRLQSLMVDLSRELYADGAYSETPLKQLMVIAAMGMVDPQRKLDPQAIPDLTEKERDLLGKLQAFFGEIGQGLDGKSDSEQSIVEAVNKLHDSLVKQPQLRLPAAALCSGVMSFGSFSEFSRVSPDGQKSPPMYAFVAHTGQQAIVYLEIADFTSAPNEKGEHVTEISQQLTIYSDRDGIPVWREPWQSSVDRAKNKRQDFYTTQLITFSKALSVGRYTMKIQVRDEKSQAEAETSIPFEMVADPKMASVMAK